MTRFEIDDAAFTSLRGGRTFERPVGGYSDLMAIVMHVLGMSTRGLGRGPGYFVWAMARAIRVVSWTSASTRCWMSSSAS
jgi:hypothetical protein